MTLREDCRLHGRYVVVLLFENSSFYLRVLQDLPSRPTFLTPRIPIAEADLIRLAQDQYEPYHVEAASIRLLIQTAHVFVTSVGSDIAAGWGGRSNFQSCAIKLLRSAGRSLTSAFG